MAIILIVFVLIAFVLIVIVLMAIKLIILFQLSLCLHFFFYLTSKLKKQNKTNPHNFFTPYRQWEKPVFKEHKLYSLKRIKEYSTVKVHHIFWCFQEPVTFNLSQLLIFIGRSDAEVMELIKKILRIECTPEELE